MDKTWENRGFGSDLKVSVLKQVHTFVGPSYVLKEMDARVQCPSVDCGSQAVGEWSHTGQIQGQQMQVAVRMTASYTADKENISAGKVTSGARTQENCERVIRVGFPGTGNVIPSSSGHLCQAR